MPKKRPPNKRQLIALRKKKTREQIAEEFGVSVSCVKRWIAKFGVTNRPKLTKKAKPMIQEIERTPTLEEGFTLVEIAKFILKDRLKEDWRGYLLDGRLCNVDAVISAANLKFKE